MTFEYDVEAPCGRCGGDGGHEFVYWLLQRRERRAYHPLARLRSLRWEGTVTVHMRPIDFEDLAKIEDDDADPYGAFAYRGGNP